MRPEGLSHCKIPVTPSRIEPESFRLVAECQFLYATDKISGAQVADKSERKTFSGNFRGTLSAQVVTDPGQFVIGNSYPRSK